MGELPSSPAAGETLLPGARQGSRRATACTTRISVFCATFFVVDASAERRIIVSVEPVEDFFMSEDYFRHELITSCAKSLVSFCSVDHATSPHRPLFRNVPRRSVG